MGSMGLSRAETVHVALGPDARGRKRQDLLGVLPKGIACKGNRSPTERVQGERMLGNQGLGGRYALEELLLDALQRSLHEKKGRFN